MPSHPPRPEHADSYEVAYNPTQHSHELQKQVLSSSTDNSQVCIVLGLCIHD